MNSSRLMIILMLSAMALGNHEPDEDEEKRPPPNPDRRFCNGMMNGPHSDWRQAGCAQYYISCNHGHPWRLGCPDNLYYDGFSGQCLRRSQVPACCKSHLLPKFSNAYFDCKNQEPGDYADPNYVCAAHFIGCAPGGQGAIKYCPDRLVYCAQKQRCLRPTEVEDCPGTPNCD